MSYFFLSGVGATTQPPSTIPHYCENKLADFTKVDHSLFSAFAYLVSTVKRLPYRIELPQLLFAS